MRGHIQIGPTVAELKDYLLVDPVQRVRSRVNPLAAKIGQGASQFGDHTAHEFWQISNWSKGIGYNADAGIEGGYLYGEVDSRAGDYFILPPLLTVRTAEDNADISPTVVNITSGNKLIVPTGQRSAIKMYIDVAGPLYVFMDAQGVVAASIHADDGGKPGAELWAGVANSNPSSMIYEWTPIINDFTPTLGVTYWLVLHDDSAEVCLYGQTSGDVSGNILLETSPGVWADTGKLSPYIAGSGQLGSVIAAQTVNDELFSCDSSGKVYKWNRTSSTFALFADTGQPAYDMQLWFGELIVTHGAAAPMSAVDVVTASTRALAQNGTILAVWNGYLWFAYENSAGHATAADLSTWKVIECGPDDYEIRGMTGLGDDILVSTDQAIWRIAPGYFVLGITKWAYQSKNNGVNMINNQGVAFIPADNTLVRMQPNAPLINIWKRDEALPGDRAGIIGGAIGTNKEVVVYIEPADAEGVATLWSFNNEGWHHVARLPTGQKITCVHYDNANDSIWIFSDSGHAYSFYASSTASSPSTDGTTTFHPAGWVDMGRFHGGLPTIIKDFDAVRVVGENISPTKPVTIFWRSSSMTETEYIYGQDGEIVLDTAGDPLISDKLGWSVMGDITQSGQELRWEDHNTRPVDYGITLAYSVSTDRTSVSPEIEAVVVKYHSMVVDSFRWQLPIMVSNRQQMIDGSLDPRTVAELMQELEAMEIDRYLPFFFRDVDERVYEVKAIGFAERLMKFEKVAGSAPDMHHVIDFTLQEIAPYTTP